MTMRRFSLLLILPILAGLAIAPAAGAATKYRAAVGHRRPVAADVRELELQGAQGQEGPLLHPVGRRQAPGGAREGGPSMSPLRREPTPRSCCTSQRTICATRSASCRAMPSYKTYVGKLIKRYKAKGVTDWGAWNEANHKSQETWNHPVVRGEVLPHDARHCARAATSSRSTSSISRATPTTSPSGTRRSAARTARRRAIVGIHNYSDTNRIVARPAPAGSSRRSRAYNKKTTSG